MSLATKTFLASIKYISVSMFNSYSLCHITLWTLFFFIYGENVIPIYSLQKMLTNSAL